MRILLDTCAFLWLMGESFRVPEKSAQAFRDTQNTILLSVVSVWKIIVKHALGQIVLPEPASAYVLSRQKRHGIVPLALEQEAVMFLSGLPPYHRDPFDRMLVCQAMRHDLTILTPDSTIGRYGVKTLWNI